MNFPETIIVYCSPNGTTKTAAERILKILKDKDVSVTIANLADREETQNAAEKINKITEMGEKFLLFAGCPVYASRAIPPVMDFIENLPQAEGSYAVPFITWGGVTKGFALYDLALALSAKGLKAIGGAEILAVHSMMWKSEEPVAKGHPSEEDLARTAEMVEKVLTKISNNEITEINYDKLKEGREGDVEKIMNRPFHMVRDNMPPKKINEELCNSCSICADVCPAHAIELSPYPEFNDNCIVCFACVKNCPEQAIEFPAEVIMEKVKGRAAKSIEESKTCIYA